MIGKLIGGFIAACVGVALGSVLAISVITDMIELTVPLEIAKSTTTTTAQKHVEPLLHVPAEEPEESKEEALQAAGTYYTLQGSKPSIQRTAEGQ